jgi:hypothetical protein
MPAAIIVLRSGYRIVGALYYAVGVDRKSCVAFVFQIILGNTTHNSIRAVGERGNSLLKTTFKALRHVSLDPWRIGNIVAVALVILHLDHARTT